jgi:DNA repair protein RadC
MSVIDSLGPIVTRSGAGRNALHVREVGGEFRPATSDEVFEAARLALARKFRRGSSFTSPGDVSDFLRTKLARLEHEVFAVMLLDTRHRLIEYVEIFRGTIDGAAVHPREVVKLALTKNAAAMILAHNHPSGVAEPSESDRLITRRLQEAMALVEVRVLDHIVIGADNHVSLAARGWI